jgi:ribosomal protein L11 methyltransferase
LSTLPAPSAEQPSELTHYLTITCDQPFRAELKEEIKAWLVGQGIDSFVEGAIEHCDIPDETGIDKDLLFDELGGNESPIVLYSYDLAWLQMIASQLKSAIPSGFSCEFAHLETTLWQEGWKESFRPITTALFYLYPPWEETVCPAGKIPLIINPGMAFGTGQHATTQLSLEALENVGSDRERNAHCHLLDVGTGSGILAIASSKLGYTSIDACDIDPDSLRAVEENCALNQVDHINSWRGSVQPHLQDRQHYYHVIIANILYPVLEELLPDFVRLLATNGVVILSGILTEQKAAMLALCTPHGLSCQEERDKDDWSCIVVKTGNNPSA